MALALAVIVTLGVGVPIAAWSWTRLRPPPAPSRLGTGYDPIDRWLLRRHSLAPIDRERVRAAVFEGRQAGDAKLALAAHDLADKLLSREIGGGQVPGVLRWLNVLAAVVFAALGIGMIAFSRRSDMQSLGAVGLVDSAMFTFVSVVFTRQSKRIRHRVEMALELNHDHK
jgi:ABC-type transport system involved in cytochrome c biogenesis permease subunit